MRFVKILTFVPQPDRRAAFDVVRDFARYPEHATTVRAVTLREDAEHGVVSDWEVDFRGGILRWVEQDSFDPDQLRVEFSQVSGDIDHFSGYWQLGGAEGGSTIEFGAWFDLGIPTLEDVLEPIAEDAIVDNIVAITAGLFGAGTRTLGTDSEPVAPEAVPAFPGAR